MIQTKKGEFDRNYVSFLLTDVKELEKTTERLPPNLKN